MSYPLSCLTPYLINCGMWPYVCTLPKDHESKHEAWSPGGGHFYASWDRVTLNADL